MPGSWGTGGSSAAGGLPGAPRGWTCQRSVHSRRSGAPVGPGPRGLDDGNARLAPWAGPIDDTREVGGEKQARRRRFIGLDERDRHRWQKRCVEKCLRSGHAPPRAILARSGVQIPGGRCGEIPGVRSRVSGRARDRAGGRGRTGRRSRRSRIRRPLLSARGQRRLRRPALRAPADVLAGEPSPVRRDDDHGGRDAGSVAVRPGSARLRGDCGPRRWAARDLLAQRPGAGGGAGGEHR